MRIGIDSVIMMILDVFQILNNIQNNSAESSDNKGGAKDSKGGKSSSSQAPKPIKLEDPKKD